MCSHHRAGQCCTRGLRCTAECACTLSCPRVRRQSPAGRTVVLFVECGVCTSGVRALHCARSSVGQMAVVRAWGASLGLEDCGSRVRIGGCCMGLGRVMVRRRSCGLWVLHLAFASGLWGIRRVGDWGATFGILHSKGPWRMALAPWRTHPAVDALVGSVVRNKARLDRVGCVVEPLLLSCTHDTCRGKKSKQLQSGHEWLRKPARIQRRHAPHHTTPHKRTRMFPCAAHLPPPPAEIRTHSHAQVRCQLRPDAWPPRSTQKHTKASHNAGTHLPPGVTAHHTTAHKR
jgi:hypothetical protein